MKKIIIILLILLITACNENATEVLETEHEAELETEHEIEDKAEDEIEIKISPKTNTVFYKFSGGDLPDDIVTVIDYSVTQHIRDDLPIFTFRFEGITVQSYGLNASRTYYYLRWSKFEIQKLTITDEYGNLIQEYTDLNITKDSISGLERLTFDDWNFDGYLDFSLPIYGLDTAYFLWDSINNMYVRNEELEILGGRYDVIADSETERLVVSGGRMSSYFQNYYEYINGEIILVEKIEESHKLIQETEEGYLFSIHFVYYELIDGEMVMVDKKEYTEIWN